MIAMPFRTPILLTVLVVWLALPAASALAASVTISGNDDNPTPLVNGMTLRHMRPDLTYTFGAGEERYSSSVTGPNGQPASEGRTCADAAAGGGDYVKYQGDGTYTLTLGVSNNFDDADCAQATTQTYTFNLDTHVAILSPANGATLPLRPFDDLRALTHPAPLVTGIMDADIIAVRYARDATFGADGGITGALDEIKAMIDPLRGGNVELYVTAPGAWTVQARARIFVDGVEYFGPWSAPTLMHVVAPFDLDGGLRFPDRRGPTYKLSGIVGERSTRGSVTISAARGAKGTKFKKLGVAKIGSGGRFGLKFTIRKRGVYRLRLAYAGSATTAAGTVSKVVRIRKVIG